MLASSVDRDVNDSPVGQNWLCQWFETLSPSFTFTFNRISRVYFLTQNHLYSQFRWYMKMTWSHTEQLGDVANSPLCIGHLHEKGLSESAWIWNIYCLRLIPIINSCRSFFCVFLTSRYLITGQVQNCILGSSIRSSSVFDLGNYVRLLCFCLKLLRGLFCSVISSLWSASALGFTDKAEESGCS